MNKRVSSSKKIFNNQHFSLFKHSNYSYHLLLLNNSSSQNISFLLSSDSCYHFTVCAWRLPISPLLPLFQHLQNQSYKHFQTLLRRLNGIIRVWQMVSVGQCYYHSPVLTFNPTLIVKTHMTLNKLLNISGFGFLICCSKLSSLGGSLNVCQQMNG